MDDAVKALNIYFAAFIFMDLQYIDVYKRQIESFALDPSPPVLLCE